MGAYCQKVRSHMCMQLIGHHTTASVMEQETIKCAHQDVFPILHQKNVSLVKYQKFYGI